MWAMRMVRWHREQTESARLTQLLRYILYIGKLYMQCTLRRVAAREVAMAQRGWYACGTAERACNEYYTDISKVVVQVAAWIGCCLR